MGGGQRDGRRPSVDRAREGAGIGELTPTERRVLLLLADLKTTKEIAAELGVSPRTVDNHRAHMCSKLELQGSHALTFGAYHALAVARKSWIHDTGVLNVTLVQDKTTADLALAGTTKDKTIELAGLRATAAKTLA